MIVADYLSRSGFDAARGAAQYDDGRRAELVRAVNALLETKGPFKGEPPMYTREKLRSWIAFINVHKTRRQ